MLEPREGCQLFWNRMIGHEQSGYDFPLHDMPFHDLCDVCFCADPVPHSLGIDHHTGAEFAMVQAAGLIGTNETFDIQSLGFALEMCVKFFRAQICATTTRIVLRTLVGTHKDMSLKRWHKTADYTGMVRVLSRSIRSVTS